MYIPKRYEEKDKDAIKAFIKANSFGILISISDGKPIGTHIPLLLAEDAQGELSLLGHISKGNEQKHTLQEGALVLAIFAGPHAYISPRWYTEMNVPTWNYLAVHAYGTIELMEGQALEAALSDMVDYYEQGKPQPVTVSEIPEKTYKADLRGIIGFRIRITELQAAAKLSQNRDEESFHNVLKELDASTDPIEREVAKAMKDIKKTDT
jgi:transcriptional regulator